MTKEVINTLSKIDTYKFLRMRYENELRLCTDIEKARIIQDKIDATNKELLKLRVEHKGEKVQHQVLRVVCNYFGISVKDFNNKRPYIAKKLAIYLLYNFFEFTIDDISGIFNESPQNISEHRAWLIKNWNPDIQKMIDELKILLDL